MVFYTNSGTAASGGANSANVSEKMRISPVGNLGIGTTVPNSNYKLTLKEGLSPTQNAAIIFLDTDDMVWGFCGHAKADNQIVTGSSNGDFVVGTSYTSDTHLITNDAIRMTVNGSTGNVGIGTQNTVPKFRVNYASGSYGTEATSGIINTATSGRATFRNRSDADEASEFFYDIGGAIRWDVSVRPSNETYQMNWYPQGASPALNSVAGHVMHLKQTGEHYIKGPVGIGTDAPTNKLHIRDDAAHPKVMIHTEGGNAYDPGLYLHGGDNLWGFVLDNGDGNKLKLTDGGYGNIDQDDTRMIIDASGHITPGADNTQDLGSTGLRWRNIYTTDLELSNEDTGGNDIDGTEGTWTIQEGEEDLFLLNRKNGKKYKFNLTEIE